MPLSKRGSVAPNNKTKRRGLSKSPDKSNQEVGVREEKPMAALDYSDVKHRVQNSAPDVVDELYSFGEKLVSDAVDRLSRSDSKASALAAYCGGLVALMVSTSTLWGKYLDFYSSIIVVAAVLSFMISAWLAAGSTHPQPTEWYSDNDWLREECLQARERLRRYRVLTMWRILTSHQQAFRAKTRRVRYAVLLLKMAFVLLFVALLDIAWRYSPFQNLRIWVW